MFFLCQAGADAADIRVYKGDLQLVRQSDDGLVIRYRSRVREVLRIGVSGLYMINIATGEPIRLADGSASLASRPDRDGYWSAAIVYDDLELADVDYRIDGRLALYLAGSQRNVNFSAYLDPGRSVAPPDTGIDWGLENRDATGRQ